MSTDGSYGWWTSPDLSPVPGAVIALNIADAGFTHLFLSLGVAEELNPIMRTAYEQSPAVFLLLKLAMVGAGLWMLMLNKHLAISRMAVRLALVVYSVLFAYHVAFLAYLGVQVLF